MSKKNRPLINPPLYRSQKEYYKRTYATCERTPWEGAFDTSWLAKKLGETGDVDGKWALDMGTGRGTGAQILARAGYQTVGVDYQMAPLLDAKKKGTPSLHLVHADLFALPFLEGQFDVALDWGVFHHIRRRDTGHYLANLTTLLKPGGWFFLGAFSPAFRHSGEKERNRPFTLHHGHYDRFLTKDELFSTFSPRFAIRSIEHDTSGFWLVVMRRY